MELCSASIDELNHDREQNRVSVEPLEDDYDRKPFNLEQARYDSIVWNNYVIALLAGAELTARDGKTKWSMPNTDGWSKIDIETEAKVIASYLVG